MGAPVRLGSDLVVLVAEDHDFQRRTIVRMLQALGVREVLQARNGFEALAVLKEKGAIDLLICDLDMEQMDGMELMRNIGGSEQVGAVLVLSGHELSLLNTVTKMAQAYGVRLLRAVEKPLTLIRLGNILALPDTPALATDERHEFDLDEIVSGIQKGQFEAFFQPKVSISSGEIAGAEALARWRHPELGVIGPDAFIPTLEKAGAIEELTYVILKQAASACRRWGEMKYNISVAVNISLASLRTFRLVDHITAITETATLDPRRMILEITETVDIANVGETLENLARLRMRGFGLSIDDYGTGFANLQKLQLAPFTELKIDRSFVTGCADDAASRAIMESSVQMARQFGFISVGEGVETLADWNALKDAGCDLAQGFLIARPMSEAHFLTFLTTYSA